MIKFKDMKTTRISLPTVTSYYADQYVSSSMSNGYTHPAIKLTIGSVELLLTYANEDLRNEDIKLLDQET